MWGPCICTLSKDMRMGRDARMSLMLQDASTAVFAEYPSSLQFREPCGRLFRDRIAT